MCKSHIKRGDIKDFMKTPIAHRGIWHSAIDENTIKSFKKAIQKNMAIECDVQILADGTCVVFHDRSLIRLLQKSDKLKNISYHELNQQMIQKKRQKVPTLEMVLKCVNAKVPLLLELKSDIFYCDSYIDTIMKCVQEYNGIIAFSSFDARLIKKMKLKYPQYLYGHNFTSYESFFKRCISTYGAYVLWKMYQYDCDFFAIHSALISKHFIYKKIVKKTQKPVFVWGLHDRDEYMQKKDYFDQYFFDQKIF